MINRRQLLKNIGGASAAAILPFVSNEAIAGPLTGTDEHGAMLKNDAPFMYCLNMATIRGHKLGLMKELEVASRAGFTMVEIWMDSLQQYLAGGGSIRDVKLKLDDLGVQVVNSIGFARWIVDDDAVRKEALEQTRKEMDLLASIGCKRIAAPPMGATDKAGLDLKKAADRYRAILELGDASGVVPQLELWGFSKNLRRLSEVMYVAVESSHASARVLLDVYHLYKGESGINTLSMVGLPSVEILHLNDYTTIAPGVITDADRIHPGDGQAPIKEILKQFKSISRPLIISEEVFNPVYYKQDALLVAKTALQKMKAIATTV